MGDAKAKRREDARQRTARGRTQAKEHKENLEAREKALVAQDRQWQGVRQELQQLQVENKRLEKLADKHLSQSEWDAYNMAVEQARQTGSYRSQQVLSGGSTTTFSNQGAMGPQFGSGQSGGGHGSFGQGSYAQSAHHRGSSAYGQGGPPPGSAYGYGGGHSGPCNASNAFGQFVPPQYPPAGQPSSSTGQASGYGRGQSGQYYPYPYGSAEDTYQQTYQPGPSSGYGGGQYNQ